MSEFARLSQSIQSAVQKGAIGTPVFLRLTLAVGVEESRAGVLSALGELKSWLGADPSSLYATATSNGEYFQVVAEFSTGVIAVIASVTPGTHGTSADVIILGNHGAAYHDSLSTIELGTEWGFPAENPKLSAVFRQSLEQGTPQRWEDAQ